MSVILLKNGRVWDGERFFFADVLAKDGRIAQVAPTISEPADFTYDAREKIVSAGLVDAHMHMRGISSDAFGIQAESGSFPFGVTAAADASGVFGDKALLDSFMLKNCVYVCANFYNDRADFAEAEARLKAYGGKAIGIKVFFDTQVSEVSTIAPLQAVVAFAREKGLRVMVHSSNSPVSMSLLLDTLGPGDILTHAYHGGENNVSEDGYACIRKAKQRGVIIDAGFAGHIHTDFRVFQDAVKCGAEPDIISTDITNCSAYTRGGRYGMPICMSIAKHAGIDEDSIFRAVTSAPAKALGMAHTWGYLQEGRSADIAVLEYGDEGFDLTDKAGNRIYSEAGYRCVLTVSDGTIVYKR